MADSNDILKNPAVADFFKGMNTGSFKAGKEAGAHQQRTPEADRLKEALSNVGKTPSSLDKYSRKPETKSTASNETEKSEAKLKPRTKLERYREMLESEGITVSKAAEVIDSIITQMYYEESYQLTKNLRFTFRTRTPKQSRRINELIKDEGYSDRGEFYALIAKYNLAASLVSYNGHTFDPEDDDGMAEVIDLIERMPYPLYNMMVEKLSAFDHKLAIIMQEGALENF